MTRLDVARDFVDVDSPTVTLEALVGMPRKWARTGVLHFDPKGLGTQTLSISSGTAGMTRLYDKWAETSGAVPPGTMRFEAECRKPWLKAYGKIKLLGDVTPERVERLARNRWEWSQMGVVTVGNPDDLVAAVRGLHLRGLDGPGPHWLDRVPERGRGLRPASRTTEAKLRRRPVRPGWGCRGCRYFRAVSTSPVGGRSWRPFERSRAFPRWKQLWKQTTFPNDLANERGRPRRTSLCRSNSRE